MVYKAGEKITYSTPLSGGGEYEAEILVVDEETEARSVLKVKILKVICPTRNPIGAQKAGDIEYIIRPHIAKRRL